MRIAVFSTKPYDRTYFAPAAQRLGHELTFLEPHLTAETAKLAEGFPAVCAFVNDTLDAEVLGRLKECGVRFVTLRCAGYNNVDLAAAAAAGIPVVRVPAYSPYAVAEHTVGLILTLNRHIHRAWSRVREGNFSLAGLVGFDLNGSTVGIIGTGEIGCVVARILAGFGCQLLAHDVRPNPECEKLGARYVPLDELLANSDIITLHCPLLPATKYLVNSSAIARMKRGVMLINTSRGGVIDTRAVIDGLKTGQIGYLGLDVYEEEGDFFFEDLSSNLIGDDVLARLLTFPNVLITGHQAFLTRNALARIAETTLENLAELDATGTCKNAVVAKP
jgi:D-lactate dehydrogenase